MGKKRFSGWSVVAAMFLFSFFATAIYSNCLSLYMHPVCDSLQLSSTTPWSMINLIAAFASAGGAMAIAGLYQGKHFKLFMLLCIAASGALFALASICTAIWQFYIVFCLSNIFLAGLTQLPISVLITAWFEDKRSVAMSIAFCGSGVGTAIWSPVLSKIIASSNVGYKHAFVFSGAVVTVALVIICLLLVKRCPEEYGQEPYRQADGAKSEQSAEQAWTGVTKKTATKSSAFGAMVGTVMLVGALASGVTTHVPNYLMSVGWTTQGTGYILSVYSIVVLVATIIAGFMMDRWGIQKTVLAMSVLIVLGMICLYLSEFNMNFAWGYCVFFGLTMSLPRMLPSLLTSTVFGTKDYAGIYALLNLFFLIGAAVGSVLTSILQGILGYGITWMVYAGFAILLFCCVTVALSNGNKLRTAYPNGELA